MLSPRAQVISRAFAFGLAAWSVTMAGRAEAQVRIGVSAPLSGPDAAFGQGVRLGAEQAVGYRRSFAHYTPDRLLISIVFYGSAAMLCFGAFVVRYREEFSALRAQLDV